MRSLLLAVATSAALTAGAHGDDACARGSSEVLTVKDWQIEPADADRNRMTETLVLNASQPVRLIDGSIVYADALGDHIGSKAIDRDAHIAPGEEYVQTGTWGPYTFERLLKMNRADVVATACVEAVIYADGTKEEFGEAPKSLADELSKLLN